ncbi:MAG: ATP-binding protein [Nocardioides sp.]
MDTVDSSAPGSAAPAEVHELAFHGRSNSTARRLLGDFLLRQGVDVEVIQDAAIVLGELISNGLDHGRPDRESGLEVTWQIEGGSLHLSVCDGGGSTSLPHVVDAGPESPRGRGLAMVQALTVRWWVESSSGTRVTAVLACG